MVQEATKSAKALVLLEVLGLRRGERGVKIFEQEGLDIKDAHRTPSPSGDGVKRR